MYAMSYPEQVKRKFELDMIYVANQEEYKN